MKPMLACDFEESKLRFPYLVQPKIDGVRALHTEGRLTTRRLKPFANKHVCSVYASKIFHGLDGEMVNGVETAADACRLTTSAVNRIEGNPTLTWYLFDYVAPHVVELKYEMRLTRLHEYISELKQALQGDMHIRLEVIRSWVCEDSGQLAYLEDIFLKQGYEGVILRRPDGRHKQGRATVRENTLLRIKRFEEDEAEILDVLEGETNLNEQQVNELGKTFRSTHAENMIANGQVGTFICKNLKTGETIRVGPGEMDIPTRRAMLLERELLKGRKIIYKHFPKGVKDKPRFPTFKTFA